MATRPANTTAALWRFWEEFKAAEPDAVLGGIYAAKGGYHNTRDHHRAGTHRGSPDDYSIQRPADQRGPGDKASALDITFKTAQRGDYRVIAKYSKRLMAAGRGRDKRFYDSDGETAIVREFFGNVANDGKADGWSWYRERAASSDPSHLWHIHLSITRAYVDDWSKLAPILDVLLGRSGAPTPSPTPEDDMTPEQAKQLQDVHNAVTGIGSVRETSPDGKPEMHSAGYYLAHGDRNAFDGKALTQNNVLPALKALAEQIAVQGQALTALINNLSVELADDVREALEHGVVKVDVEVRDRTDEPAG